jgi:L-asparaginase / beta-aspartyl-peptidase
MIAIMVHGGAGHPVTESDGCLVAAQCGWQHLASGGDALTAIVNAIVVLENDGRYNAGRGSLLRMDGRTIEMDAGIMDTRGALGAVAAIREVTNPVLVAQAVADTPHWMLAGRGAYEFARAMGLAVSFEASDKAHEVHRQTMSEIAQGDEGGEVSDRFKTFWNFDTPWQEAIDHHATGTVGAVALDSDGHFAAGASTGGSMPVLMGRVGDTPIVGCGYFAGSEGAIAVTGIGEHIVPRMLARTVYGWLQSGMPLQQALNCGVDLLPPDSDIGLIGLSRREMAFACRPSMPTSGIQDGEIR